MKHENRAVASTLPSHSSAISYPNIEAEKSGQDGMLMEEKDEVNRHICSQAQADFCASWEGNRPSTRLALQRAGSHSSASTISNPATPLLLSLHLWEPLTTGSSTSVQPPSYSHVSNSSRFNSVVSFHVSFLRNENTKCWVLAPFPLPTTRNTWCTLSIHVSSSWMLFSLPLFPLIY